MRLSSCACQLRHRGLIILSAPHVLIVSYLARDPLTPRGARTQAVAAALARRATVGVIAGAQPTVRRVWHQARDRALFEIGSRWLMDPVEPWSWKAIGHRTLEADVALLSGYPFSPLVLAARRLRRQRVPYVVDLSDPWTTQSWQEEARSLRDRRNRALERALWAGAAGGILTTRAQAQDVRQIAPTLDLLVRPNGYAAVEPAFDLRRRRPDDELRIGHFGNLYGVRLDMKAFFRRLVGSRRWRKIVVRQFGRDHGRDLDDLAGITVEAFDPVPWSDVVQLSTGLDLALVVGNQDSRQLPSKAIEYLTLPVPRLALIAGRANDALAEYLSDKPGWLTLTPDDTDVAARVWAHVHRSWDPSELAPPRHEAWESVADQLATFVLAHADRQSVAGPHRYPHSRHRNGWVSS